MPGTLPLYRYWNVLRGDHFYTTSWAELGPGKYGYVYEGVQTYVFSAAAANRVPLYRYWNAIVGDHFYTTNWAELGWGKYGYGFEGIQCYVATQVRPPSDTDTPEAIAVDMEAFGGEPHGSNGGAPNELTVAGPPVGTMDVPSSFGIADVGAGAGIPSSFASAEIGSQLGGQASSFATSSASPSSSFEIRQSEKTGVTLTIRIEPGGSSQA